jgi:hypothetical protein
MLTGMHPFIFYALIALGTLVGVVALIAIIGMFMPRSHQVARSLPLKQTPEAIWQVISDFPNEVSWHPGVLKVERMPDKNGHEVWHETYKGGYAIKLETLEATPPRRLVRSIADEGGPFSGRWEFDIAPVESGSRITIIEYGDVSNPFFRFMARMFMNPAQYLELYLRSLAAKFNEPAAVT